MLLYFLSVCIINISQPNIVFDNCDLYINGTRLNRNLTLTDMTNLLGPFDRQTKNHIFTWDKLGIYIYLDRNTQNLAVINLSIFEGNSEKSKFPLPFNPLKRYKRKVKICDHWLSTKSSIEDIERIGFKKDRYLYHMYYGCHKLILNYLGEELGDLSINLSE